MRILEDGTLSTLPNLIALDRVIINAIMFTNMRSPVIVTLRCACMNCIGTSWYSVRIAFGLIRVVLPCNASTLGPKVSSVAIKYERVTGHFLRRLLSTMSRYVRVHGNLIVFSFFLANFA